MRNGALLIGPAASLLAAVITVSTGQSWLTAMALFFTVGPLAAILFVLMASIPVAPGSKVRQDGSPHASNDLVDLHKGANAARRS